MNPYNRKAFLLAVLLAVLSGCGSPKPSGRAGKEIADAQQAIANAKGYADKGEFDKAAVEYSRANEIIAKGRTLATSMESPQLNKLEEEALGGIAEVQKRRLEKEKAAEEAGQKEALANKSKRWRSRVAIPAAVDYLNVLPANAIVVGQLKDLGGSVENAKKTAMGRLITSQELAPLWQKLEDSVAEQRAGARARAEAPPTAREETQDPAAALKQKAKLQEKVEKEKAELHRNLVLWLSRFKGQFAGAVWQLDFQNPAGMRAAAVAEISDPVPEAVVDELMEKTEFLPPAGPATITYKDVDIWMPAPGGIAVTLLGRHLVIGPNPESVKVIVDGFFKPGGFGASPACVSAKSSLGPKPETLVFMDFEGYMRAVINMMGAQGGADTKTAFQKMMNASGANMKMIGMASACTGEGYEDRSVALTEGELKGFGAMMRMAPDAPPPLNALAFVPANAALATVSYVNALASGSAMKDYLDSFKELTDSLQKGMPKPPPGVNAPPGPPDFGAILKAFEEKTGVKLDEVASGIKGETGCYVAPGPGLVTQPPDLGIFTTFTTPEKAQAFCEAISKALGAYFTPTPVKEQRQPERTVYQLDLQALGQALNAPVPPNFPYTPCWAVEKNRFFLASSPQALQKQLSYVDSRTPGLLAQPDFVKALGALTAEERKGQIMYVDAKSLLTAAAMLGLPLLQGRITDPEVKSILQGLPPPQVLFKDIPPMIMGSVQRVGRVESVFRGPLPPVESAFILAVGAGVAIPLMVGRMEMGQPPVSVPPPKPPGQF